MSDLRDLLERIVPALNRANVPFMVAGSFASAAHGLPRSTNGLDIVIDPTHEALDSLLEQLPAELYYVDADIAREALRRRSMFNVIDHATGWKVDFIVRRHRPFSREEFGRRSIIATLGESLDRSYLQHWLHELELHAEWALAQQTPIA
jgi:hypothetical protein